VRRLLDRGGAVPSIEVRGPLRARVGGKTARLVARITPARIYSEIPRPASGLNVGKFWWAPPKSSADPSAEVLSKFQFNFKDTYPLFHSLPPSFELWEMICDNRAACREDCAFKDER
jgi:hypothetical protein